MIRFKHYFLLMLLSLCSIISYAYDFEVDGLYYNLVSASGKTCELVGCKDDLVSVKIPSTVTVRGMELSIVNIKPEAFENNTYLEKLQISAQIELPASAFSGCTNLREVSLCNGVKSIEDEAFYNCPIDSLFVPNTVNYIGENAINLVKTLYLEDGENSLNCGGAALSMKKLYIGRNLITGTQYQYTGYANRYYYFEVYHKTSICGQLLDSVQIGPFVNTLGASIFEDCCNLTSLYIPKNIKTIGKNAFKGCSSLRDLIIEDCDESIKFDVLFKENDFGINSSSQVITKVYGPLVNAPLETVYIGRNIDYYPQDTHEEITLYRPEDKWGFAYIEHFFQVSNPSFFSHSTIKEIGYGPYVSSLCAYMFQNQSNPLLLKIPESIKSIGNYCFYKSAISELSIESHDVTVGSNAFAECESLRKISFNGVNSLGDGCFSGCTALKIVELGDDIQTIGKEVFKGCVSLHKADLGALKVLSQGTFSGCLALNWINFGQNFTVIENGALSSCKNLYQIGLTTQIPPTVRSASELSSINKFNATLYIPQGTISAYEQADVWKDFLFKEEKDIPEYIFQLPKSDDSEVVSKNMIVKGNLTGAIINQINASSTIETLDLQAATIALDNKNAYYETGKRIDNPYLNGNDADVYKNAPYYSYKYCTAPETLSGSDREYSSSNKLINVIITCFSSELTYANLNANLKSIKLPSSLVKLGENAIKGDNLTDLYVYSTTPPTALAASFGNTNMTTCVLHVPEGCKETYASALGWKDFKNIVDATVDNYIEVQPTNDNRQIKLAHNDEKATYQWYKYVNKSGKEIDITNILSSNSGWENSVDGWHSNMHDAESSATLSYEHDFNAGDVLSFDWSVSSEEIFDQLQFYLGDELLFVKSGEQSGSFNKMFEKTVSGKLSFVYIKDNIVDIANDKATISNVKISSSETITVQLPEAIVDENFPKLTFDTSTYGEKVFCLVTLGDGKQIKSNELVLEYANFIKTQPTVDNLCVELDTPEKDAKYQWYQCSETKVNSKTITPTSSGTYVWSENNGVWTSGNIYINSSSAEMSVSIDVQTGDKLSFDWNVSSESGYDYFICNINDSQVLQKSGTDNGTYEKVFTSASTVSLEFKYTKDRSSSSGSDCATVSNLCLIRPDGFVEFEDTEIEGAINTVLDKSLLSKDCEVYCVVTLANGRILISDRIPVNTDSSNDYIIGDANGDGRVSITDVSTIAGYLLGSTPDGFSAAGADANGDGRISITDVSTLASQLLAQ